MHCLQDETICRTKMLDGIEVDFCPLCQGVWIEQSEVKRLVNKLLVPKYTDTDELINEFEVAESKGVLPKDFWIEDKLECPHGHGNMGKHYFGGSHIGVDQCQTCKGFWLNGGELKAIAKQVEPNPKIDAAWQEFIRDQTNFREKLQKLSSLPASIASYFLMAKNIPMLFALTGAVLLKFIIDGVISADRRLGNLEK